jgi:glycosyltransferase involved in cell wall biosynthesis
MPPPASTLSLTAVILTFNEEIHIARCLDSAFRVASRVVVVDSFSKDRTVEIARASGAEVLQRPWKNYADQFQWGLDNSNCTTDWIIRLDADEVLDDEHVTALHARLAGLPADVTGLVSCRKMIFKKRWIRWGGYYPSHLIRIFRRGAGRIEQRWMDEHIVLDRGRSEALAGHLIDEDLKDFHFWIEKHNGYATRSMLDFLNLEHPIFPTDAAVEHTDNAQARRKRYLKEKVFGRMPLFLRPAAYFIYRYVFLLGFLDGRYGFVFHFNHAFWYRVLESMKLDEARRFIATNGLEAFKAHIRRTYGLKI